MIIIEHNLELIKCADWIIDLGPEGGNKGQVVCQGTPEDIIQHKDSYTAQYLMKNLYPKTSLMQLSYSAVLLSMSQ